MYSMNLFQISNVNFYEQILNAARCYVLHKNIDICNVRGYLVKIQIAIIFYIANSDMLGAGIFFRRGVPNLQKVNVDKTVTPPISATRILWPPHHWYTLPPKQAKIVLKSVLNKINTLSVVILWLPTFWSSKILWHPLFFFPKIYDPQNIWDPPSKENASPLTCTWKPQKKQVCFQ